METYKPDVYFDFNKLKLSQPVALSSNSYFTSLSLLNGNPILIQTPPILTKNGFVKSAKKNVCDLVFDSECSECIQWFENLETNCYRLLHEQSTNWFQNTLEYDDIENAFSASLKSYKSGKCQICRCNVSSDFNTQSPKTKIYDENELPVSYEDINDKTKVIVLLEVRGIKFTTRSFQLDFDIRQMMIVAKNEELDKCLIKRSPDSTIPIGIPIGKNGIQMGVTSKNKQEVVEEMEEVEGAEEVEEVEEMKTEQKDLDDVEEVLMIEDKAPDSNQSDIADIVEEIPKTEETLQDISDELQPWDTSKVEDVEDVATTNNLEKEDTPEEKPEIEIETKPLDSVKDITSENSEIITQPIIPESDTIELELQEIEIADPIFDLSKSDSEETIKIKTPNDVYHELYKNAKQKARKAKEEALQAIMEANSIKNTYMLDEIDESDLSDFDEDDEDNEEDDQEEYQGETLTIH